MSAISGRPVAASSLRAPVFSSSTLAAFLLLASVLTSAEPISDFAFREISPTGLELSDGGKPVFVYNFGMTLAKGFPESMRRSSYLHPVYSPGGVQISDDFNPNHPHHRGISWMWPEVTVDGKMYMAATSTVSPEGMVA